MYIGKLLVFELVLPKRKFIVVYIRFLNVFARTNNIIFTNTTKRLSIYRVLRTV